MEDRNQHIDQYFRQQLGGYTELPTPDVWTALEQRLDEKPRKKRVLWIWFTLLFLAAIGGTAFYTYRMDAEKSTLPSKKAAITPIAEIKTDRTTTGTTINQPVAIPTPTTQPAKKTRPVGNRSVGKKATQSSLSADPILTQSVLVPASESEPETTNNNETLATETAPLHPVEPLRTEITKPDTEHDILQLVPTAGITVPIAKQDEEEFLALTPSSGNKKIVTTTEAVQTTLSSNPAEQIVPTSEPLAQLITSQQTPMAVNLVDTANKQEKVQVRRFSAGLKAGYEFGTKPYHANSFVLSPYMQYNFSKRVGLLLQPAFKYSHSEAAQLSYGSYTQTTDSLKEMLPPVTPNMGSGIPTGQDEYMAYQKTYDSIFIRNELRDVRYWNLDLPLMLSYKVHKNFSVYAGPAFHFTKVPKVVTTKQTYSGLVLNDTLRMERKPMSAEFDTLNINQVFPQKGFDISQYNGSAFDNPTINPFKMGVTIGLSYSFMQRFHFDILYRQTLSKMDYIANDKVRELLKQPYIRVTLGFDLLK